MRNRIQSTLLLAALWAGCASELQSPPRLHEVCRAQDDSLCVNWAYAGERVDLKLLADNLTEVWDVDLGNDDPPVTRGAFRAWIADQELEQVQLVPDSLRGHGFLVGVLPGQLPVDRHRVTIESPAGQQAVRGDLFEIRDPVRVSLAIDKPTLPRGDRARLTAQIDNRATVALQAVTLELVQGGSGAFLLPDPPPPFSLGAQTGRAVDLELIATSPGQPQLAVMVSATADGRIAVGTEVPVTIMAAVLEQALLWPSASIQPTTGPVGSQVSLALTVANQGGVTARGVSMLLPAVSGAGQIQWNADPGISRDIAPGQEFTFRWYGTASAPGTAYLIAAATGTEALSGRQLSTQTSAPLVLVIR